MKILITGATGLVGSELIKLCLAKNYTVHYLTTSKTKIVSERNYKGFYWNPSVQEIDENCLIGIDAIINLAGASISRKWTTSHKKAILKSRIDSLQLLYQLLSENKHTVRQLCSASALGIYPSSFTKNYDESYEGVSSSFLGGVVEAWEKAIDSFQSLDLKITKIRIGIVLSKDGGALTEMIKPIKLGVGAPLGSGKQWQSWIHIADLANIFLFVLEQNLSGIYNAAASNPVTNAKMTEIIARQLKKSLFLPNVPTFMMKLILGKMSVIVLESQYLKNDKIKKDGFVFEYDTLDVALKECLI
jgi:uncharacterized protein (TIGR01777 family)